MGFFQVATLFGGVVRKPGSLDGCERANGTTLDAHEGAGNESVQRIQVVPYDA